MSEVTTMANSEIADDKNSCEKNKLCTINTSLHVTILTSVLCIMICHVLDKGTMVNHDLARFTMIMTRIPWLRTLGNAGVSTKLVQVLVTIFAIFCIQHEIFPHRWPPVVHPLPPQNVSWPPRWPPVGLRWEVRWPPVGCPGLSAREALCLEQEDTNVQLQEDLFPNAAPKLEHRIRDKPVLSSTAILNGGVSQAAACDGTPITTTATGQRIAPGTLPTF